MSYYQLSKQKMYWWKCEDCGEVYPKISAGEPRRGCPTCGAKGVKTFIRKGGWRLDT